MTFLVNQSAYNNRFLSKGKGQKAGISLDFSHGLNLNIALLPSVGKEKNCA